MIIRAKLQDSKSIYRDIYLDPFVNLHTLASYVVDAFGFDFDHSFGFFQSPDIYGKGKDSEHFELFYDIDQEVEKNCGSVARTITSDIFVDNKQKWWMLFDYGDDWVFELEFIDITDEGRLKSGTIIKTNGEAHEQYDRHSL